jgi:hypothetical protein
MAPIPPTCCRPTELVLVRSAASARRDWTSHLRGGAQQRIVPGLRHNGRGARLRSEPESGISSAASDQTSLYCGCSQRTTRFRKQMLSGTLVAGRRGGFLQRSVDILGERGSLDDRLGHLPIVLRLFDGPYWLDIATTRGEVAHIGRRPRVGRFFMVQVLHHHMRRLRCTSCTSRLSIHL